MSALDRDCKDRSYCFGRIAAVYEIAELRANKTSGRMVPTLTSQLIDSGHFRNHPADSIMKLGTRFSEISTKLSPATKEFFKDEIGVILDIMDYTEENFDKSVNQHFTEGYYHETSWLREGK